MYPVLGTGTASHKEILLFSILLGVLAFFPRIPSDLLKSVLLAVAVAVLLLTHEGLAPYLLYVGLAIFFCTPSLGRVLGIAALPAIAAVGVEVFATTHTGTPAISRAVCDAIHTRAHVCGGAIAYLGMSKQAARIDVLETEHKYHFWRFYPFALILAVTPLVGMWRDLYHQSATRRQATVIAGVVLCAWLGTIPLFRFGTDWGRWIYIHVLCSLILMLYVRREHRGALTGEGWFPRRPTLAVVALVLYATCWNMPCWGPTVTRGYLNGLHLLRPSVRRTLLHPDEAQSGASPQTGVSWPKR